MNRHVRHLLSSILALTMPTGCALNYPTAPDADLFIPMLTAGSQDGGEAPYDYAQHPGAFRISKALENEYFINWLQDVDLKKCSTFGEKRREKTPLTRITKILQPLDWDELKSNRPPYTDAPGGVLFGRAVEVQDATLLSLRFALTPLASERYRWCSKRSSECVDLPYRYLRLEDISLSDEAIALFDDSQKTKIYKSASGETFLRFLEDGESVILDVDQIGTIGSDQDLPERLPIQATRNFNLAFTDGSTNAPVLYDLPVPQEGYIELVNLSHFGNEESSAYMSIARALVLAQAGECDTAFSVYGHIAPQLDRETRAQMLFIIAHLRGQSGQRVDAVLDELDLVVSDQDRGYLDKYRLLDAENP